MSTTDSFEPNSSTSSLGARVTAGAAWLVGMRWGIRVLGLVSTLVLARLLMPEDFGVVALASACVAIVDGLTALPMGEALIRYRDAERSLYDTAWTLSVLRGVAAALVMVASAVPVAILMGEIRLELVIAVLALKPLLEGLANPRFIDFEKNLVFSKLVIVEIGTKVVAVGVVIGFAIALRSYWALIIGNLVSAALKVGWSYILKPHRPRFTLKEMRTLFGFAGWLSGASVFQTLNLQSARFVIGRFLSTSQVGFYFVGEELVATPIGDIVPPLIRAMFPGFAMIADDLAKLRTNALQASAVIAALGLPVGVGFALVGEDFVKLALGEKWLPVVPLIQLLSPVFAVRTISAVAHVVAMSRSRTDLLFFQEAILFPIQLSLLVIGVMQFGFMGAVYAQVASGLIYAGLRLKILNQVLDVPLYLPILQAWRSLVSVGCMSVAVLGVTAFVPPSNDTLGLALMLLGKVSLGALTYVAIHSVLWLAVGRPSGVEARLLTAWPKILGIWRRFRLA